MSIKVKEFEICDSEIVEGVKTISPSVHKDNRGILFTTYYDEVMAKLLPNDVRFKHDKFAGSGNRVLRGIHGDTKSWKLVTVVHGEITQVVVDNRPESPTYKKWESFKLISSVPKMILLPPGVGNAFYVHSIEAIYHYKLAYSGEYFDASDQFTLKWNDPGIGIMWPDMNPILSDRDK